MAITTVSIIDKKRRGGTHTPEEIATLVERMVSGEAADYQIAAWLMAACINGLTLDETTWLTEAFVQSGEVLDLSAIDGVVVDKHSTGGVGDKTTLVLAPLLAAAGAKVVKLSGRGLGFTGGTIDKLEAIHGFKTALTNEEIIGQVNAIGVAISSQTASLAPADAKMYALRDVTATVDYIPLIAASVVSKKIATGAPVIVLDIKAGRGAFMKTVAEAEELAKVCREVAKRLGRSLSTVISSMEQPLGLAIGHSVEVLEAVETLKGKGPNDLRELCLKLGSVALVGAGLCITEADAEARLRECLTDGSAFDKLQALVRAQGGEVEALEDPHLLPQPERIRVFPAEKAGTVADLDPLKLAQAAKLLGAGRTTKADVLDLGVGVVLHKKVGDTVEKGETLVELYVGKKAGSHADEAVEMVQQAITLSDSPVKPLPLIESVVAAEPLVQV